MKSIASRISAFSLFLALCSIPALSQTTQPQHQPPPAPSETDLQACKTTVDNYCQAWISKNYDAMHALLSNQGMGKQDKEKFALAYGTYASKGGNLTGFTVEPTATVNQRKNEEVLVKAELKFEKEVKPRIVQGTHTFMLVKDGEGWKIKHVMPPVKMVKEEQTPAGGSKPGE